MSGQDYVIFHGDRQLLVESSSKETYCEAETELKTRLLGNMLVDQLIACRKAAGMTQQDIADITGLPRTNISRIERKLYTPTLGILMKYANSLGKEIRVELADLGSTDEEIQYKQEPAEKDTGNNPENNPENEASD